MPRDRTKRLGRSCLACPPLPRSLGRPRTSCPPHQVLHQPCDLKPANGPPAASCSPLDPSVEPPLRSPRKTLHGPNRRRRKYISPPIRRINFVLTPMTRTPPPSTCCPPPLSSPDMSYSKLTMMLTAPLKSRSPLVPNQPNRTHTASIRSYRKQTDAIFDSYLAAELIQHSSSPWSSYHVEVSKTHQYHENSPDRHPTHRRGPQHPRRGGSVLSISDRFLCFTQPSIDEITIPLTAL